MDRLKEKYKLSRYNVFHRNGDVQYLWNTYSDALVKLDKNGQEYIRSFAGTADKSFEFDLLKTNGFIVYEKLDELGRVCMEEKQAYYATNADEMVVAIVPGMGCNCRCSYCFQSTQASLERTGVMTPEVAIEVGKYICQQLNNNPNTKELFITWFGGEPLLYLDIIEIISRIVIEYTQAQNIKYAAGIPTNGQLLDPAAFEKLQELQVTEIQITFDGMRDTHCVSKGVSAEDFDRVLNNLFYIAEKIRPLVRLNIPKNDLDEAIAITDFLLSQHNLLNKAFINFSYVCNYSQPREIAQKSYVDYMKNYLQWIDYFVDRYGVSHRPYPERIKQYCGRISVSNFCIGPRGELHRCLHCIGDKTKIIGDIWNGFFYNIADALFFSAVDSSLKKECPHCSYLPICMGACVKDRIKGYVRHDCESDKQLWIKLKLLSIGVKI